MCPSSSSDMSSLATATTITPTFHHDTGCHAMVMSTLSVSPSSMTLPTTSLPSSNRTSSTVTSDASVHTDLDDVIAAIEQCPEFQLRLRLPRAQKQLLLMALYKLRDLVGMRCAKNYVANQIRLMITIGSKKNNQLLHMVIRGEPGCGKTTLAACLAEVWIALGIVSHETADGQQQQQRTDSAAPNHGNNHHVPIMVNTQSHKHSMANTDNNHYQHHGEHTSAQKQQQQQHGGHQDKQQDHHRNDNGCNGENQSRLSTAPSLSRPVSVTSDPSSCGISSSVPFANCNTKDHNNPIMSTDHGTITRATTTLGTRLFADRTVHIRPSSRPTIVDMPICPLRNPMRGPSSTSNHRSTTSVHHGNTTIVVDDTCCHSGASRHLWVQNNDQHLFPRHHQNTNHNNGTTVTTAHHPMLHNIPSLRSPPIIPGAISPIQQLVIANEQNTKTNVLGRLSETAKKYILPPPPPYVSIESPATTSSLYITSTSHYPQGPKNSSATHRLYTSLGSGTCTSSPGAQHHDNHGHTTNDQHPKKDAIVERDKKVTHTLSHNEEPTTRMHANNGDDCGRTSSSASRNDTHVVSVPSSPTSPNSACSSDKNDKHWRDNEEEHDGVSSSSSFAPVIIPVATVTTTTPTIITHHGVSHRLFITESISKLECMHRVLGFIVSRCGFLRSAVLKQRRTSNMETVHSEDHHDTTCTITPRGNHKKARKDDADHNTSTIPSYRNSRGNLHVRCDALSPYTGVSKRKTSPRNSPMSTSSKRRIVIDRHTGIICNAHHQNPTTNCQNSNSSPCSFSSAVSSDGSSPVVLQSMMIVEGNDTIMPDHTGQTIDEITTHDANNHDTHLCAIQKEQHHWTTKDYSPHDHTISPCGTLDNTANDMTMEDGSSSTSDNTSATSLSSTSIPSIISQNDSSLCNVATSSSCSSSLAHDRDAWSTISNDSSSLGSDHDGSILCTDATTRDHCHPSTKHRHDAHCSPQDDVIFDSIDCIQIECKQLMGEMNHLRSQWTCTLLSPTTTTTIGHNRVHTKEHANPSLDTIASPCASLSHTSLDSTRQQQQRNVSSAFTSGNNSINATYTMSDNNGHHIMFSPPPLMVSHATHQQHCHVPGLGTCQILPTLSLFPARPSTLPSTGDNTTNIMDRCNSHCAAAAAPVVVAAYDTTKRSVLVSTKEDTSTEAYSNEAANKSDVHDKFTLPTSSCDDVKTNKEQLPSQHQDHRLSDPSTAVSLGDAHVVRSQSITATSTMVTTTTTTNPAHSKTTNHHDRLPLSHNNNVAVTRPTVSSTQHGRASTTANAHPGHIDPTIYTNTTNNSNHNNNTAKWKIVSRVDFVAEYTGHTAPKTEKLIKSMLGGVLIIDEAYSLVNGPNDTFGMEAIDVINQWMTNRPNDILFVLIGYAHRLEQTVFKANSGMGRRFQYAIDIEPYTPSEMMNIFEYQLKKASDDTVRWVLDDRAKQYLDRLFRERIDEFHYFGGDTEKLIRSCQERYASLYYKRFLMMSIFDEPSSSPLSMLHTDTVVDDNYATDRYVGGNLMDKGGGRNDNNNIVAPSSHLVTTDQQHCYDVKYSDVRHDDCAHGSCKEQQQQHCHHQVNIITMDMMRYAFQELKKNRIHKLSEHERRAIPENMYS